MSESGAELTPTQMLTTMGELRHHLSRFMASYQFAMQEVETKVTILQQEFQLLHQYNPIEHVSCRLKTLQSVIAKARRQGCAPTTEDIRREIRDIAGVRVVCSFASDVYRVQEMLCGQADIEVLAIKDYIAHPKPSGYRSLHAIIEVPVFLSDDVVAVPVEMQFRTVAQDFWASLEHKIFYKYDRAIPPELQSRLQEAARTAAHLDAEMMQLSIEIDRLAAAAPPETGGSATGGSDGSDGAHTVTDRSVADFLDLLASYRDGSISSSGTGAVAFPTVALRRDEHP